MEDIISYLHTNCSLSRKSAEIFAEAITVSTVDSGTIFIEEGRVNTKEYLILDGICRSYLVNSMGDDITLSFFTSNVSPNMTRTKLNNSILNVQALTTVKLATFLAEDLGTLMKEDREIELWGSTILQNELLQKVEKEVSQISMSATDRLLVFREKHGQLENLIPHSYIASYLGIANVSLSRIRSELSKK